MAAYVGSLRELLMGRLGTVPSEVLTFTDALTWSGATVHSGSATFTGAVSFTGSGAIPRTSFATNSGVYSIPIAHLSTVAGAQLLAAELAGGFNVSLASNVLLAQGEITDNETEVSVAQFQFALPPEYLAGGTITVGLPVRVVKTAAATDNGSTIDLSVYKQAVGAVGADLCATAAQTFAAMDTWYTKSFTVTPTNLVAGDILHVVITSSIIDNEVGGGTLRLNMDCPIVTIQVLG